MSVSRPEGKRVWIVAIDTVCTGPTISCAVDGAPQFFESEAEAVADIDSDRDWTDVSELYPLEVVVQADGSVVDALSGREIYNPYAEGQGA